MKATVLKKIDDIERRTKSISDDVPDLIMIYPNNSNKWVCDPKYPNENTHRGASRFGGEYEHLKDFYFPEDFHGRVIFEAYGSPEKQYYENLLIFDADEVREGQEGAFCIVSTEETDPRHCNLEIAFRVDPNRVNIDYERVMQRGSKKHEARI